MKIEGLSVHQFKLIEVKPVSITFSNNTKVVNEVNLKFESSGVQKVSGYLYINRESAIEILEALKKTFEL